MAIDIWDGFGSRREKNFRERQNFRPIIQQLFYEGRNVLTLRICQRVVGPAIPGLRAVPDLVPIHPILPPTVHIHL